MSANLDATITLDNRGFLQAGQGVQAGAASMRAGLMRVAAPLAALTAGFLSARAAIQRFRGVIDMGGDLDHLRQQTGMGAGEMMVFRQALDDTGVGAGNAANVIRRMQQAVAGLNEDGEPTGRVLKRLGIDMEELRGKTPMEQMRALQGAFAGIEDPADRSAAAVELFGRSGQQMLSFFASSGAMDDAAGALGKQAELMEKNSATFERVSTLMSRAGLTLQGFFVGLADKVAPVLIPMLEKLESLDLAEKGQAFGERVAAAVELIHGAFASGELPQLFGQALIVGGTRFLNTISRGLLGLARGWIDVQLQAWGGVLDFLRNGLLGIANQFGAALARTIAEALPDTERFGIGKLREGLSSAADSMEAAAQARADGARAGLDALTPQALLAAFADGMAKLDGFDVFNTEEMEAELARLIRAIRDKAGELRMSIDPEDTPAGPAAAAEETGGPAAATPQRSQADRLAQIGGFIGGGSPAQRSADRTAKATEQTAKEIAALRREMFSGGAVAAAWG